MISDGSWSKPFINIGIVEEEIVRWKVSRTRLLKYFLVETIFFEQNSFEDDNDKLTISKN